MKNSLDFNVQFSNLWCLSFPNCFAGVYAFLEGIKFEYPKKCRGGESFCFGCACAAEPDPQSAYFVLFDTLCGRSAIWLRFDQKPTDMMELIGDGDGTDGWSGKCGTDHTIDFLFGLTGYEYRKLTDSALFTDAVVSSIDAGKPVVAELFAEGGSFRAVTGYDGEAFECSLYYTDQGSNTQEKQIKTYSCRDMKTLYVIGDKTAPRYGLKDGLERIKRVVESGFAGNIWDDGANAITEAYITPTDEEFGKMDPDGLNALKGRAIRAITNQFNSHTFGAALLHLTKLFDIARFPELQGIVDELERRASRLNDYAHAAGHFNGIGITNIGRFRIGIGKAFVTAIEDIKQTHLEMLEIIGKAIDVMEKYNM